MTAIAGVLSRDRLAPQASQICEDLSRSLAQRGAAVQRLVRTDCLWMVQRGPAPLEPSPPQAASPAQVVAVADARLDNADALRRLLSRPDRNFASNDPSQIIAFLYEDYGLDFASRIEGRFAAAVWDARANRLVLARDRMGESPLFLLQTESAIYFASELSALVESRAALLDLDAAAVADFFHLGFVPEPATIVRGVRKPPPGGVVSVEVQPWRTRRRRYWRLEESFAVSGDPVEAIHSALDRACGAPRADETPCGVVLSPDIESAALAARLRRDRPALTAFSVHWAEGDSNSHPSTVARLADRFGMSFQDVPIDRSRCGQEASEVLAQQDEPLADLSAYLVWRLSLSARRAAMRQFWNLATPEGTFSGPISESHSPKRPLAKRALPGLAAARFVKSRRNARYFGDDFLRELGDYEPLADSDPDGARHTLNLQAVRFARTFELTAALYARLAAAARIHGVDVRSPWADYRYAEALVGLGKVHHSVDAAQLRRWRRQALAKFCSHIGEIPNRAADAPTLHDVEAHVAADCREKLREGFLVQSGVLQGYAAEILANASPHLSAAQPAFRAVVLELWCRATLARRAEASRRFHVPAMLAPAATRQATVGEEHGAPDHLAASGPAPIALFVFKRPWHTEKTLESLAANDLARESELFVFSDGPRGADDADAVRAVRDVVRRSNACKRVHLIESAQNRGLAASIIHGVGRLVHEFGRVVVLEDDLVLSPWFLEYMNASLDRYARHARVMQIAGNMFVSHAPSARDSVFLPIVSSWGWATWRRAWRCFDENLTGAREILEDEPLRRRFDLMDRYPYSYLVGQQMQGRIDSWAIRWYLSVFRRDGLVLYPTRPLVRNIGFDGTGVHCETTRDWEVSLSRSPIQSCPRSIEVDQPTFELVKERLYFLTRAWRRAQRPVPVRILTDPAAAVRAVARRLQTSSPERRAA